MVAVRTYQSLRFYRVEGRRLSPLDGGVVNLRPLQEIQGEAVALGPDGTVALTSEGGPLGGPPSLPLPALPLGRSSALGAERQRLQAFPQVGR